VPTVTLPRADYTDSFSVASTGLHTAEEWARAAFRAGSLRDSKQVVRRRVLQLDLGPLDDPRRVTGWAIVDNQPHRLVLAAESWHLVARLVFGADAEEARVTTLVIYRHLVGRLVWAVVRPGHRRAVPHILAAARRLLA
jgi:hypothetical protein